LRVQRCVVDTSIVNTVLFTTGDTDLHLEPDCEVWMRVARVSAAR
jgi:hypothetical protein